MLIKHRGSLGQDLIGNFWIKVEKYTRELGGGGGLSHRTILRPTPHIDLVHDRALRQHVKLFYMGGNEMKKSNYKYEIIITIYKIIKILLQQYFNLSKLTLSCSIVCRCITGHNSQQQGRSKSINYFWKDWWWSMFKHTIMCLETTKFRGTKIISRPKHFCW